ncbi:MAG: fibronectin type III-like domain-contianing protein, partial [Kiritimatiellaeota bacterium]|nr:fibronectin type III-like domain-contianing protein [Kiritimatiellota bacterium]
VQLYVSGPQNSKVFRPARELRAFAKTHLKPGESKAISFRLGDRAFSFYNTKTNSWCIKPGKYGILIGASSQDIRLRGSVTKSGASKNIPDQRAALPAYSARLAPLYALCRREMTVTAMTTKTLDVYRSAKGAK